MLFFGGPLYMFYDPTYILVLIGVVISLIASVRVKTTFNKYQQVRSMSGYTGASAAEAVLRRAGIGNVRIERIAGSLTDHYDPRSKVLRLSDSVYNSSSIAAIAVACHEAGHACQDARHYVPLKLRAAFVPVVNIGTNVAWIFILLGLFITSQSGNLLLLIGVIGFSTGVAFQLITLPVEFNASRRAMAMLRDTGILREDELRQGRKVLTAAALTYVAGAAAAILQLLRILLIVGGRRRDS